MNVFPHIYVGRPNLLVLAERLFRVDGNGESQCLRQRLEKKGFKSSSRTFDGMGFVWRLIWAADCGRERYLVSKQRMPRSRYHLPDTYSFVSSFAPESLMIVIWRSPNPGTPLRGVIETVPLIF